MLYSEAKAIRAEIIRTCPAGHKARNISKRVMQSLRNEREYPDYIIDDRYSRQLEKAHNLIQH